MEKKRFFQDRVINPSAPFKERWTKALEISEVIGTRASFPDGLSAGQATMVAIREAGCGGFGPESRTLFRQIATGRHIDSTGRR